MKNYFVNYLEKFSNLLNTFDEKNFLKIIKLIQSVKKNNKKIILVGNGGSAAIASHVSIDLTKVCKVRSINFNESSLLTCFSNDYGYEEWVKKALLFYADRGDLIILISSSGESMNIVNGAIFAKKSKLKVVTLTGFNKNNKLKKLGHVNLWVDSNNYNFVENAHQIWLLMIVDYLSKSKL